MKIYCIGAFKEDGWEHFKWFVEFGDVSVEYRTGMGLVSKKQTGLPTTIVKSKRAFVRIEHEGKIYFPTKPKLKEILYSLAMDANCGTESFDNFCANLGYDTDSRKALEIYLACQESGKNLAKIMKSKNYLERITSWEL